MKTLTFALFLVLSFTPLAQAASVWVAGSATRDAVNSAIGLASSGDTVIVPPAARGTVTWVNGIIITNKVIRLIASGTNSTFITDSIPKVSPEEAMIKYYASSNSSGVLHEIAGFNWESGITIQEQTHGKIRIIGDSKTVRFHHNVYTNAYHVVLSVEGFIQGVGDHNRIVTADHTHPLILSHDAWQPYNGATNMLAQIYNYGHGSWADEPYWGSEKFWFWESNFDEDNSSPINPNGIDIFEGGRLVHRKNQKRNALLTNHGTEGQGRGHKQSEDYGNGYWADSTVGSLAQSRGGTILTYDNVFTNYTQGYNLRTYRLMFWRDGGWAWAGGTNVYDDNVQHPVNGYWFRGQHNGGMANNGIVDTLQSWSTSPKQWVGTNLQFVVRNLTKYNASAPDLQPHSYVTDNTATTITYSNTDDPNLQFDTGDFYEVWAVNHALDQNGQGTDNGLMNNLPGSPAMWPTNRTEPSYMWNQTLGFRCDQTGQGQGRDWFNSTIKTGYTAYVFPHPFVAGPGTPNTPFPANSATGVDPALIAFTWGATNAFFYDIYLDTVNPPLVQIGLSEPQQTYSVGPLASSTTYFWRIVARNYDGYSTNTWTFSTSGASPPVSGDAVANGRRRLIKR